MTRRTLLMMVLPAAAAMAAAGCLESEVELAVQRDGSGVLTETVWLTQAALEMGGGLMGGKPGEKPKGEFSPMVLKMADKATLEKRAAGMGEGVTLKSVTPQKHKDGRQGYVAVYDVKDVNRLKLGLNPAAPRSRRRPGAQPKAKQEPMLIQYKAGSNKITIVMPKREAAPEQPAKPPAKPADDQQKQMSEMVKMMFAGMKIAVRVKVPGTITKTNASLVNEKKDGVTLMEMDVGALIQDEKLAKKLAQAGRITDVAVAREKLNDPEMKKYVKFEPAPKVEIEFK